MTGFRNTLFRMTAATALLALAPTASAQMPPAPAQAGAEQGVVAAAQQIDAILDRNYPALDRIYRDLHAHPEIAFLETRSAAILAARMRKLGLEVTEGVGKTGVVAMLRNGPGPVVLVRTDIDGLPMEEKTGLPYASKYTQLVDGQPQATAHSCGQDIHMTWWLGAAEALLAMKDRWSGTVMFVAQPAEETTSGARAMLDDHLFQRFPKPDFGFAAHVMPAPEGTVLLKSGAVTSISDIMVITFNGKGAHGSAPNLSIDPIVMGSHFVSDVQSVISREKEPGAFGVVTVGSFQSGTVANIIPDTATLKLTLRSQSDTIRQLLVTGVQRNAKAAADMAGAPAPTLELTRGSPMVRNNATFVPRMAAPLKAVFGPALIEMPSSAPAFSAAEDFSEFAEAGVPSVYYWIGGYDRKVLADLRARGEAPPANHSPFFAPRPEVAIRTGVKVLALSVIQVAPRGER